MRTENHVRRTKRHCSQVGFQLYLIGAIEATGYLNRRSGSRCLPPGKPAITSDQIPLSINDPRQEIAPLGRRKLQGRAAKMRNAMRIIITEFKALSVCPRCSEATLSRLRKSAVQYMSPAVEPQTCSRADFHRAISCLPDDLRSAVAEIYEDVRIPTRDLAPYVATILVELANLITRYSRHMNCNTHVEIKARNHLRYDEQIQGSV
jgi:hypothetical protein